MWASAIALVLAIVAALFWIRSGTRGAITLSVRNESRSILQPLEVSYGAKSAILDSIPPGGTTTIRLAPKTECAVTCSLKVGSQTLTRDLGYIGPELSGRIHLLVRSNYSTVDLKEVRVRLF
jgi:hypothetical protein